MNCTRASLAPALFAAALVATSLVAQEPAPAVKTVKSPLTGFVDGRGPAGPVKLKIVSPKPDEVFPLPGPPSDGKMVTKGAEVVLRFELKNYELFQDPATKGGQYIQILLDGRLVGMHFQADKGWTLKNVPKGTHVVRAFVARPWHEAIKEGGAMAAVTFHVGEKELAVPAVDPTQPTLSIVRPRGKMRKADAARVLFDVFVTGCRITAEKTPDACQVQYRLGEKPPETLTTWTPVFWENLPVGRHVVMAVLARDGKFLGAPVNVAFDIEEEKPAASTDPAPAPAPVPGPGGR